MAAALNLFPCLLVFVFIIPAFAAPGGTATLDGDVFEPDQILSLRIEAFWEGAEDRYEIRSHRLELPEGIEEKGVSSSTHGGSGGHTVVYVVRLAGGKEGEYAIDSIEFDYREKGRDEVFTKRLPGVSFSIVTKPIVGTKNQWILAGGALLILLCVVFGIFAWQSRRRKNDAVSTPPRQLVREELLERLEECRRLKTEGELGRFFHGALLLHKEIASFESEGSDKKEVTEIEKLAERVKYGGVKPGGGVAEKHFKDLEKRIKNL